MANLGTGAATPDLYVPAVGYSYNWINLNYGSAPLPTLVRAGTAGNATYMTPPVPGARRAVWDGTAWVTPRSVYDQETGQWLPYDKVWSGSSWV